MTVSTYKLQLQITWFHVEFNPCAYVVVKARRFKCNYLVYTCSQRCTNVEPEWWPDWLLRIKAFITTINYVPRTKQVLIYLQGTELLWLTKMVALSWSCLILSFAIFSSFVGDIERLTAADKPSLDDSSGLFACQQQNQDMLSPYCSTRVTLLVSLGSISRRMSDSYRLTKKPLTLASTSEYSDVSMTSLGHAILLSNPGGNCGLIYSILWLKNIKNSLFSCKISCQHSVSCHWDFYLHFSK